MVSSSRLKEKNTNVEYTKQQMSTFRKDNIQDYAIYEFFNKTLWEKIDKYGHERMTNDVEKIKKIYKGTIALLRFAVFKKFFLECDKNRSLCEIKKIKGEIGEPEFQPGTKEELLKVMAENGGTCSSGVFKSIQEEQETHCSYMDEEIY